MFLRSSSKIPYTHVRPLQQLYRVYSTLHNNSYPQPKAIAFSSPGVPSQVLRCVTLPLIKPPSPGALTVKIICAPINPSDINVVEGVYPSKPSLLLPEQTGLEEGVYIGGNEGLAQVLDVGEGVTDMEVGDWVIMTKPQSGTWLWGKNVRQEDVLKIPKVDGLTEVHAATITVNPPTAYNMLTSFITLKHGATHVFTYDDLADKTLNLRGKVRDWTGSTGVRLGLNCVGGKETSMMANLLGQNSHLISYGAMSKQPLSLSTSLFIFKNLTAHGFWQTRWYSERSREERENVMKVLVDLMTSGKLKAPEAEIIPLNGSPTEIENKVRNTMKRLAEGGVGKKLLLQFTD
ncbi:hypothetical protein Clacol_002082 [Clathrus columnatus]|uniref:enoyl-[acyl-carrier-protein] reductase n=1 Tax=Clathrus columnatus TaxID=1419009 RepID=A0AAV4ZZS2_9AGAM|nr:hypothetical protein Clacol_002082 [Clathrus columnatus]